ncbi:hypothetical protein LTR10_022376 [Elasticomyces elasticus]|uniref:Uncharacterized protein n=1 Tax=Exophiala sideris TaxID=1016849 RepID=A0ABR0J7D0_9EURO|nr:hypothetical protein LTR10_022376 [Elasticomyces elasticus]KAK5029553.1 hypothetical protein LTS07_006016 [Exophiala sideris]KAK5036753.1 hypothetical protein LTR13_005133 [Exophiala sideris]KAK5058182.1 hypothetical protein LTR69_007180 [Exophiala sideris]KAK5182142.1 hypothetical protein LTR44_005743 [Eurotiomycetes sp. CCFEE 6388]
MPLASIHLIALTKDTSIPSFLSTLKSSALQPLVVSKVIRWIITPSTIDADALLKPKWDILLITPGTDPLPDTLTQSIQTHWSTTTGIPSRLTTDFPKTNMHLLHPARTPKLTGSLSNPRIGSTSQTLELSSDLSDWIQQFAQTSTGKQPLSMLNLLAFKDGMKESYLTYGKAFAESIGAKRGGTAKLVGNIVPAPQAAHTTPPLGAAEEPLVPSGKSTGSTKASNASLDGSHTTPPLGGSEAPLVGGGSSSTSTTKASNAGATEGKSEGKKWDEFALASYPSILHFADMLASEDYQAVNLKYRVPALEDTLILCTSEIEIEDLLAGKENKAKL